MTRELTLTDIAGYLPYGLNIYDRKRGITTVWNWQSADCSDWNGEDKVETISGEQYSEELVLATPVLRPTSDLYREITDKDYNGGKPFVPIMELAKIAGLSKLEIVEEECDHTFSVGVSQYICDDYQSYDFKWSDDRCSFVLTEKDSNNAVEEYGNYRLFDLLHQLKFDYRGLIDAGLAVSVYDLKRNPYEAANN